MSKAVIAIVKGGLGNQLFIYATARALALRTQRHLYLDTKRGYMADAYGRSYRLDRFPIQAETMPEPWRVASHLRHPRHKLVRALNKLLPHGFRNYHAERLDWSPAQLVQLRSFRERITLLGYWQDERYFSDYAMAIRAELLPPVPVDVRNQELGRRLSESASVCVHFRRVRYPDLLGRDYYQRAIDRVRDKIGTVNFTLFGDDLAWPRQNLNFGDSLVETVEHNDADELADLWLMTRCRHAIIANSSFSWWAAWLGGPASAERMILSPAENGVRLVGASGWQRIPCRLDTATAG